ncbi:MAG TPA: hypothetical protein VMT44_04540 [Methanoregula sp.]|nr:hypothetical protein [Methanoregula sp.]
MGYLLHGAVIVLVVCILTAGCVLQPLPEPKHAAATPGTGPRQPALPTLPVPPTPPAPDTPVQSGKGL